MNACNKLKSVNSFFLKTKKKAQYFETLTTLKKNCAYINKIILMNSIGSKSVFIFGCFYHAIYPHFKADIFVNNQIFEKMHENKKTYALSQTPSCRK